MVLASIPALNGDWFPTYCTYGTMELDAFVGEEEKLHRAPPAVVLLHAGQAVEGIIASLTFIQVL